MYNERAWSSKMFREVLCWTTTQGSNEMNNCEYDSVEQLLKNKKPQ